MSNTSGEYAVFEKFNFETKPVGLKFSLFKPEGLPRLEKKIAICEVLKEAQGNVPFYVDGDNLECASHLILGMEEPDPLLASGAYGARLGHFKEPRANSRIYQQLPKLMKGTVKYVACASMDQLTFDPDVIIFITNITQAAVLLRSICYTTGKILSPKATPVIMCAWLFIHPYLSGEVNYTFSGLGAGMKSRQVVPEGRIIIAVPWDLMPLIKENLQIMPWVAPTHQLSKDEYFKNAKNVMAELRGKLEKQKE